MQFSSYRRANERPIRKHFTTMGLLLPRGRLARCADGARCARSRQCASFGRGSGAKWIWPWLSHGRDSFSSIMSSDIGSLDASVRNEMYNENGFRLSVFTPADSSRGFERLVSGVLEIAQSTRRSAFCRSARSANTRGWTTISSSGNR